MTDWRQRMATSEPHAETLLFMKLSSENLVRGFITKRGIEFNAQEIQDHHVYGTVPDGMWPRLLICYYLDGPPHGGHRARARDENITTVLEERGWKVHRFKYDVPISQTRLKEIVTELETSLRERGYFQPVNSAC